MKAKSHLKKDEVIEAKKLYQLILQAFPKNLRAHQGLTALNKTRQSNITKSPPQETVDQLVNLYNQRQFTVVVEQALALTGRYPEAFVVWNILGASTAQIGKHEEAIDAYNKALSLKPDNAAVHNNLGNNFRDQGKMEEAIDSYNKALSLKPDYADAYYNLGNALQDQGKMDEAIDAYNKALSLKPDNAFVYNNMGNILRDQGKHEEAIDAYNKALSLKPDNPVVYNNMGNNLRDQGKLDKAIETYNKALSVKHDYADAHLNLSFTFLNSGKLQEGFSKFEWRWKTSQFLSQQRHFSKPMWNGKQGLDGKTIFLWCEQGVGDTLNWSSCLSLVTSRAKHCILECQKKLVPLLERSFPSIEVKAVNKSLDQERDDFDFHLPMGSLYKNFIQDISTKDKAEAYLVPDPVRVKYWKNRLRSIGNGPYIGISWKSSNLSAIRLPNYANISELSPILEVPNVTFINLQYTDFANDLTKVKEELGVKIHNFDDLDHYNDIDDVAALCSALDIVISTQTTVPSIAAGVGTLTKLAVWKQSPWNNVLISPIGPSIDKFERNIWEPWENVFNLIANDIFKLTKY
jgi:tetratricopeptide (TPR) repeat protein